MRALLIDVDGVVVTGRPVDGLHWSTGLQQDLGVTRDMLQSRFFKPYWAQIIRGQRDLTPALTEALAGTGVSAQTLTQYWFTQDARLDPEVLADCDRLRGQGWRVYLATNQEPMRMAHLMGRIGDHVDGAFYSGAIGAPKPDPAFYQHIEDHLSLAGSELTLVDDTPANVEAATARGWRGVLWPAKARLYDALAQS